ncbi:MAG: DUF4407 domain-containing protein [Solirubrobacteraceae bacterium]|nr:DUF4407 domain-containing protein [Solirubrobacteraceae bacterium]
MAPGHPPNPRGVSDRLAWLGGADLEILQRVPNARNRFVQMALVLLTTASLAVVSMTFALADGVDVPWPGAIAFGLVWGVIILNLDRFLVLSMGSTRDVRQLVAMATPRLLMALVLSVVISTPLVLRVFQSDIDAEITQYQATQAKAQGELEAKSSDQTRADRMQHEIDGLEAILDGKLPDTVTSPELENARADVKEAKHEATAKRGSKEVKYREWQCELYGEGPRCHDASKRKGAGPLAAAKHREYQAAEARLKNAETAVATAEQRVARAKHAVERRQKTKLDEAQKDARTRLGPLKKDLAALKTRIAATANDATETNARDDGLLAQLRALSRAGDEDAMLRWAHFFVFALFFLIEILPVAVKILLSITPPSAYEITAQLHDDELKDQAKIRRVEVRQIAEDKSQARIDIEHDMRDRERTVGRDANAKVASRMSLIVEAALEDWSEDVESQLAARAANRSTRDDDDVTVNAGANGRGPFPKFSGGPQAAADDDGYGLPDEDTL